MIAIWLWIGGTDALARARVAWIARRALGVRMRVLVVALDERCTSSLHRRMQRYRGTRSDNERADDGVLAARIGMALAREEAL